MPVTYEPVGAATRKLLGSVLLQHHPELDAAGVSVAALFAYGPRDKDDNLTGPAISVGGYQAAGCIRKTSLKERAYGNADAQMLLDGDRWNDWTESRQAALIDHEITHLEVQWEVFPDDGEPGIPKRDDLNRPKLNLRLHNLVAGGFIETVKRYGRSSFDVQHFRDIFDEHGQMLMPFLANDDGVIASIGDPPGQPPGAAQG
ncbi:MAG: putative metallopeptidase [Planctomycetota bacterium]